MNKNLVILSGGEIQQLLRNKNNEIMEQVKNAYLLHHNNDTVTPFSQFLKFPEGSANRFIALPAYLGGKYDVAGLKWIGSFPKNIGHNMPRASAILILNSAQDGFPKVILEGSVISRLRTAASAALAVEYLYNEEPVTSMGIIGCGIINYEIVHFLTSIYKQLHKLFIYDTDIYRAELFTKKCRSLAPHVEIEVHHEVNSLMSKTRLLSFATTASKPFVYDDTIIQKGSLLLHISLRDLSADIILKAYNVVDNKEHVLRENTSLHLAALQVTHHEFIQSTIGQIISDGKRPVAHHDITVFSPFGLGILDVALGNYVYNLSVEKGAGLSIDSFFPSE